MSDWEIVDNKSVSPESSQPTSSDWEVVTSKNTPQTQESIGQSIRQAPGKVLEDIGTGLRGMINQVPGIYESAKTEIPGYFKTSFQHPLHLAGQALAGANEAINSLAQLPLNVAQYGANRLNLLPQSIPNAIAKITPEDTTNSINQLFGAPQYPGEKMVRGISRNLPSLMGAGETASILNPLQLTNKGIAKSVVNELNNQVDKHTKMYNSLWNKADQQGFNQVPYDRNALVQDMNVFGKSYTDKQMKSVNNLLQNPTLENAQKAQSDIGQLIRVIDERAKTTPLLQGEKDVYNSLINAKNNIEGSMFKNSNGELNQGLKNQYDKITNSYRENVVPYRYNPDIQAYLSKDITDKQLVQRLNQGPFAAKKGGFFTHPQFGIRNALLPLIGGATALGIGKYLYDNGIGNTVATP